MVSYAIGLVFFAWLAIITWVLVRTKSHYDRLTERTDRRRLNEVLETLMDFDGRTERDIAEIKRTIAEQAKASRKHLRKVGLARYNPFERTGGEQSFVITLLDDDDDGILVNFIYTREGLRAYSKKIIKGEGDRIKLSDEEMKAIKTSS